MRWRRRLVAFVSRSFRVFLIRLELSKFVTRSIVQRICPDVVRYPKVWKGSGATSQTSRRTPRPTRAVGRRLLDVMGISTSAISPVINSWAVSGTAPTA